MAKRPHNYNSWSRTFFTSLSPYHERLKKSRYEAECLYFLRNIVRYAKLRKSAKVTRPNEFQQLFAMCVSTEISENESSLVIIVTFIVALLVAKSILRH